MDQRQVERYIENGKLHKLAGRAIKGERIEGLTDGEKSLVAFYSLELISQSWSKELNEQEKLVSEELNAKINDSTYSFEWSFSAKKDLILLYKIDKLFNALKLMRPAIDQYWALLDKHKEEMLDKHKNEATYILSYRTALRLLLDKTQELQSELENAIKTKFAWPQDQLNEAHAMADGIAERHMQSYLAQINASLFEQQNGE